MLLFTRPQSTPRPRARPLALGASAALALALALAAPAAPADRSPARELIEQGDQRFNAGHEALALDLYRRALEAALREGGDPSLEAHATNNLGAAYMALGQDDQGRALFRKASGLGWKASPATQAAGEGGSLLVNGGFEEGLLPPWGTGHYERRQGRFRFGIWWNSKNARSFFKIDTAEAHSGRQSLQIRNYSELAPHVFGTTSQRTAPLAPNTVYRLTLWAKARDLERGAVSFTIDPGWNQRPISLPGGSHDWRRFTSAFCIGPLTFIDFRIIHQARGTVWLDDLSITPVSPDSTEGDAQEPLASCEVAGGRYQAALDRYGRMLEAYRKEGNRSAQGRTLLAMGRAQFHLGYYARALESIQKASELAGMPVDIDLGDLYVELGDYAQAETNYQAALKRVWGDQATRSRVFKRLGTLAFKRGDNEAALEYFRQALQIQRHIGDKASAAATLLEIGQLEQRRGRLEEASRAYEEALATSRQVEDRQLEANLETQRAFLALDLKRIEEAASGFRQAVALQRALKGRRGLLLALYGSGRTSEEAGRLPQAERDYKESVGLLEEIRTAFPAESPIREKFLEVNRQVYARLIGVLLQQGKGEEALEYLERSRSKALRDQFNHVDIAFRDAERRASWERERALAARQQAQRDHLAAEVAKPPARRDASAVKALEESLSVTTAEYRNFLYELFRRHPDLRHHVSVDPKELKRQRALLPKDLALVEYLLGDEELYCFVLTREGVTAKVVPVARATLEGKIAYLLSLAADASIARSMGPLSPSTLAPEGRASSTQASSLLASFRKTSSELYGYLIQPVASEIAGRRILGIAPDGRLTVFPFQLLGVERDGAFSWLLEDHAIFYFHSLDFLRSPAGGRGGREAGRRLVAFGNADGSLPHSEAEVASLKSLEPGASVFLRGDATEDRVKREAGQAGRLHLATHGILDYTDIRKSYLTFAPSPEGAEDGRLTLGEVWSLPLERMSLVTLSACETAVGEASAETGIVNPATAFLDAGAHSVVATLWVVDDEATSELVRRFYEHLREGSTGEALRQAQLALARNPRYAYPFYWGAFVLIGNWL